MRASRRPLPFRLALALCAASSLLIAGDARVHADTAPPDDALVAAHRRADPLLLASTARAIPESRLAALATDPHAVLPARLAAVRAAPYADDPVELLAALARVMHESDPELAPAAAEALVEIVGERVEPGRREHSVREVRERLGPALAIARDARARPDLRAASEALEGYLRRMEQGW